MDAMFWQQFWELVVGGLTLDPEVFVKVGDSLQDRWVASTVVLLAGFSQAIGQSIVLFANRIKPLRFGLSLAVSALIYFVTFIVWVLCIWVSVHLLWRDSFTVENVFRGLAVSYAPQLLGFLVAAPYFGMPIAVLLSIWTLLAVFVGIESTTNLSSWQAVLAVGFGWLLLQLGQRTIGQPLARLEQWLTSLSAGHQVTTRPANLDTLLDQQAAQSAPRVQANIIDEVGTQIAPGQSPTSRRLYRYLAIAFVSFLLVGIFTTSQRGFQLWFQALDETVRLFINLTILGLLAVGVAILMTPLESLSWWAGWRGDRPLNPGTAVRHPDHTDEDVARYVTYLDGINQGTYGYLPEVERFLDQLAAALPPNVLLVKGIIP
jgi:hypothetical protein